MDVISKFGISTYLYFGMSKISYYISEPEKIILFWPSYDFHVSSYLLFSFLMLLTQIFAISQFHSSLRKLRHNSNDKSPCLAFAKYFAQDDFRACQKLSSFEKAVLSSILSWKNREWKIKMLSFAKLFSKGYRLK